MAIIDNVLFELATVVLAGATATQVLRAARLRSLRRAAELEGAAVALKAHFEALEAIADDPAMPMGALEMLAFLSDGIADREFCNGLTDYLLQPADQKKDIVPAWYDDMEALRRTRPDLAANFFKAVGSGLTAAFLRWPGNAVKLAQFAALVSQGDRKEAVLAERMSAISRSRHSRQDHDGDGASNGGLVPA